MDSNNNQRFVAPCGGNSLLIVAIDEYAESAQSCCMLQKGNDPSLEWLDEL